MEKGKVGLAFCNDPRVTMTKSAISSSLAHGSLVQGLILQLAAAIANLTDIPITSRPLPMSLPIAMLAIFGLQQ